MSALGRPRGQRAPGRAGAEGGPTSPPDRPEDEPAPACDRAPGDSAGNDRIVALIDDDASVRRALVRRLRAAGHAVEAFAAPQEFLECRAQLHLGCVVTDLQMPGMSGLDLQAALAEAGVDVPFVFISGHGDVTTGVAAMRAGAVHFLQKPFSDAELLAAIGEALALAAERAAARSAHDAAAQARASLTPRERDVFALVVEGLRNKNIADRLGVAEKTVKIHRARVMDKMGARSLADLVRIAARLAGPGRTGSGARGSKG